MLLPFPRGLPGITPEDAAKVVRRRIAALGDDVFYRNLMLQLELGCSGCIRLRAEVPNKVQSQRWCVRGRARRSATAAEAGPGERRSRIEPWEKPLILNAVW